MAANADVFVDKGTTPERGMMVDKNQYDAGDIGQQYRDSTKLNARARMHKYGRGDWFDFVVGHANFSSGDSVLDIGCGSGWFWLKAAKGVDVTLCDQSEGMVAEALERVRALEGFSASGKVCDVCALPFEDGQFDGVLAMHMLYHAKDPQLGVSEIARVLRPGGVAVITTNGLSNMHEMYQLGHLAFGGPPTEPMAPIFGIENAPKMFTPHFDDVRFERFEDALVCDVAEDVCGALTSFPPGDEARPDQLQHLRQLAEAAIEDGGGQMTITKDVGVFIYTKS